MLKLIPGLSADILDYLAERYEAVVIEGFGIGGVPSTERQKFCGEGLPLSLIRAGHWLLPRRYRWKAARPDVCVRLGRLFRKDERVLEAYNMTLEAIVTKLMWLLACTKNRQEQARRFYEEINYDICL